jgi:hypothetical protein
LSGPGARARKTEAVKKVSMVSKFNIVSCSTPYSASHQMRNRRQKKILSRKPDKGKSQLISANTAHLFFRQGGVDIISKIV